MKRRRGGLGASDKLICNVEEEAALSAVGELKEMSVFCRYSK